MCCTYGSGFRGRGGKGSGKLAVELRVEGAVCKKVLDLGACIVKGC